MLLRTAGGDRSHPRTVGPHMHTHLSRHPRIQKLVHISKILCPSQGFDAVLYLKIITIMAHHRNHLRTFSIGEANTYQKIKKLII
jgi:hypothetical protein